MYTIGIHTKIDEYSFNNNETEDQKYAIIKKIEKQIKDISISQFAVEYVTTSDNSFYYKVSMFIPSKIIDEPSQEIKMQFVDNTLYFDNYDVIRALYENSNKTYYMSSASWLIDWVLNGNNHANVKLNLFEAFNFMNMLRRIMMHELRES